jgi:hypothetical protein
VPGGRIAALRWVQGDDGSPGGGAAACRLGGLLPVAPSPWVMFEHPSATGLEVGRPKGADAQRLSTLAASCPPRAAESKGGAWRPPLTIPTSGRLSLLARKPWRLAAADRIMIAPALADARFM